jgi:hypothetical protein
MRRPRWPDSQNSPSHDPGTVHTHKPEGATLTFDSFGLAYPFNVTTSNNLLLASTGEAADDRPALPGGDMSLRVLCQGTTCVIAFVFLMETIVLGQDAA